MFMSCQRIKVFFMIDVSIDNKPLKMEIDTSSDVNLILDLVCAKMSKQILLDLASFKLRYFSGEVIASKGMLQVRVD